jgi:Tc5 transposase DNA-binding domain
MDPERRSWKQGGFAPLKGRLNRKAKSTRPETADHHPMALTRRKSTKRKTYANLSERSKSTLWRHARSRPSKEDKAANQQYLTPNEEEALVEYILRMARNGYPISIKSLRYLALAIRRQRSSRFQIPDCDDNIKPPGKNWP